MTAPPSWGGRTGVVLLLWHWYPVGLQYERFVLEPEGWRFPVDTKLPWARVCAKHQSRWASGEHKLVLSRPSVYIPLCWVLGCAVRNSKSTQAVLQPKGWMFLGDTKLPWARRVFKPPRQLGLTWLHSGVTWAILQNPGIMSRCFFLTTQM